MTRIEINTLINQNDRPITYGDLRECFVQTFGARIVESIENSIDLSEQLLGDLHPKLKKQNQNPFMDHIRNWPGFHLDQNYIKKYLNVVAGQVKEADLRQLFDDVKNRHPNDYQLRCAHHLTAGQCEALTQKSSFEALNDTEQGYLINAFRTINIDGKTLSTGDLLPYSKKKSGLNEFERTHRFIESMDRIDDLKQGEWCQEKDPKRMAIRKQLAHSEHEARNLAYHISTEKPADESLVNGSIIKTMNNEGDDIYFQVKSSIMIDGIVGYFCTPLTQAQYGDQPFPVKVIWRGTFCSDSWMRNFKGGWEAGRHSFSKQREKILSTFEQIIPTEVKDVAIETIGHSLGGVDAMRFQALIADVAANGIFTQKNGHREHLTTLNSPIQRAVEKVRQITLYTWNSPRIYEHTANRYNSNRLKLKGKIKFLHFHARVHEDAFQIFGNVLLGWKNNKDQERLTDDDTTCVLFTRKDIIRSFGVTEITHTRPCLSKKNKSLPKMDIPSKDHVNSWLGTLRWQDFFKQIFVGIAKNFQRLPGNIQYIAHQFKKVLLEIFDYIIHFFIELFNHWKHHQKRRLVVG